MPTSPATHVGVDDYLVKSQVVIGDVVARVKHHLGVDTTVPVVPTDAND